MAEAVTLGGGWRSRRSHDPVTVSDLWTRSSDGVRMVRIVFLSGMTLGMTEAQFRATYDPQTLTRPADPPAPADRTRRAVVPITSPEDL